MGADIVTGSTQKTLPGPLGGLLFCKDRDVLRDIAQTCDDVLGDHGNARVAALVVTLSEMVAFGRDYARAIVANAQALAGTLAAEGFTVAGADQGITRRGAARRACASFYGPRRCAAPQG